MHKLLLKIGLKNFKGVHELDKLGGLTSAQRSTLRGETGILIVDDEDAHALADSLSHKFGFTKIETYEEQPDDSVIKNFPIIVTDVKGIGADEKSNGLKFAASVKKQYPLKQVIVVSGQLKKAEYRNDSLILRDVDGVYDKNADSIEVLANLLNVAVANVHDPALVWRNIRRELLRRDDTTSDKSLDEVMTLEDDFVRAYETHCRVDSKGNVQWVDTLIKLAGLSQTIVKLLCGIKQLTTAAAVS